MARIIPGVSKDTEGGIFLTTGIVSFLVFLIWGIVALENRQEISYNKYADYARYSRNCPSLKMMITKKMADHKITHEESREIDEWIKNYNKAAIFGLPCPEVK